MAQQPRRTPSPEQALAAADPEASSLAPIEWAALCAGEPAAREGFYRRYADTLHRAIRAWAHGLNAEEAEDLLAESFVRAFRGLAAVRSPEGLEGWLFGLARHTVLDHCRKCGRAARELRLEDLSPVAREAALSSARDPRAADPCATLTAQEDRARLAAWVGQTLAELPVRQQEALLAKYRRGETLERLAARLGLEANAAAALLYRARKAFRVRFERRMKEEL